MTYEEKENKNNNSIDNMDKVENVKEDNKIKEDNKTKEGNKTKEDNKIFVDKGAGGNKSSDEIAIDLTKIKDIKNHLKNIKNLFKGEKSRKKGKETYGKEDGGKELYGKEAGGKEAGTKEIGSIKAKSCAEEVSTWEYIKKHKSFFFILIPIIVCIFLRVQPAYLPVVDDWAHNSVYNFYINQIRSQVNQNYPNLPEANKNAIIDEQFKKFVGENKGMLEEHVEATIKQLKSNFQDEEGYTLMPDIDPWFWYRLGRNYLENGYDMDVEVDGKYYDDHRLAPLLEEDIKNSGSPQKINFLQPMINVVFYKIWHFFDSDVSLMRATFHTPLIISILSMIPIFLLGKIIGGNITGMLSALMLAINPFTLTRTVSGVADTDALNIFFPPLIFLMLILMLKTDNNIKKQIFYSAIFGLSLGLYSFGWTGWQFTINFSIAIIFGVAIYRVIKQYLTTKKVKFDAHLKNIAIVFMLVLISGGIFTAIFGKFDEFKNAPGGLMYFIELKEVATKEIWPNVFTTVAELNPGDIGDIMSTAGGKLLLILGLMGVIFSFYADKKVKAKDIIVMICSLLWFLIIVSKQDLFSSITTYLIILSLPIGFMLMYELFILKEELTILYPVFLTIFLFGTLFSISRGIRFSLLASPAIALCFGTFIGVAGKKTAEWLENSLNLNKLISYAIIIVVIGLLIIDPLQKGYHTAKGQVPLINDQWIETLEKIKTNSSEDAIINSWWDYGHWFKAVADRGVTLDGGGQDKPQAHWLGKLMLTSNEDESMGILRMLVCGKNYAYDKLKAMLNDDIGLRTVTIIHNIMPLSKEDAEKALKDEGLDDEEVKEIIRLTKCDNPREDYFITSEDMVSKASVWGHFGSWDFERASMFYLTHDKEKEEGIKLLTENFNLSDKEAEQYYTEIQTTPADHWVSPWPAYAHTNPIECDTKDKYTLECPMPLGNGQTAKVIVNLTEKEAYLDSTASKFYPSSLVLPTKEGVEEIKINKDNNIGQAVSIVPLDKDKYGIITSHPLHAASIFSRLFYMEGHGLHHFKKFHDVTDITGQRIITWKIDWEGKEINEPYESFSESFLSVEGA